MLLLCRLIGKIGHLLVVAESRYGQGRQDSLLQEFKERERERQPLSPCFVLADLLRQKWSLSSSPTSPSRCDFLYRPFGCNLWSCSLSACLLRSWEVLLHLLSCFEAYFPLSCLQSWNLLIRENGFAASQTFKYRVAWICCRGIKNTTCCKICIGKKWLCGYTGLEILGSSSMNALKAK